MPTKNRWTLRLDYPCVGINIIQDIPINLLEGHTQRTLDALKNCIASLLEGLYLKHIRL